MNNLKNIVVAFLTAASVGITTGTAYGDSASEQAAFQKGVAASQQGQWKLAVKYFDEARDRYQPAPGSLLNLGISNANAGNELLATCWLHSYLSTFPEPSDAAAITDNLRRLDSLSESKFYDMVKSIEKIVLTKTSANEDASADADSRYLWETLAGNGYTGVAQALEILCHPRLSERDRVNAVIKLARNQAALRSPKGVEAVLSSGASLSPGDAASLCETLAKCGKWDESKALAVRFLPMARQQVSESRIKGELRYRLGCLRELLMYADCTSAEFEQVKAEADRTAPERAGSFALDERDFQILPGSPLKQAFNDGQYSVAIKILDGMSEQRFKGEWFHKLGMSALRANQSSVATVCGDRLVSVALSMQKQEDAENRRQFLSFGRVLCGDFDRVFANLPEFSSVRRDVFRQLIFAKALEGDLTGAREEERRIVSRFYKGDEKSAHQWLLPAVAEAQALKGDALAASKTLDEIDSKDPSAVAAIVRALIAKGRSVDAGQMLLMTDRSNIDLIKSKILAASACFDSDKETAINLLRIAALDCNQQAAFSGCHFDSERPTYLDADSPDSLYLRIARLQFDRGDRRGAMRTLKSYEQKMWISTATLMSDRDFATDLPWLVRQATTTGGDDPTAKLTTVIGEYGRALMGTQELAKYCRVLDQCLQSGRPWPGSSNATVAFRPVGYETKEEAANNKGTSADDKIIGAYLLTALPVEMVDAQEKMIQIRAAANISAADKAAIELKYKQLYAEFDRKWQPLVEDIREQVEGPTRILKERKQLKERLQELQGTDKEHPGAPEKYPGEEASLQRRLADSRVYFDQDQSFLKNRIETQKAELKKWASGPTMSAFLSDADRLLGVKPKPAPSHNGTNP